MEETIFDKIISGEIPAMKVYEDDRFIAILDLNPVNTGHTLVIPKKGCENLLCESNCRTKDLFVLVRDIANNIKDKLKADGIKVVVNNGTEAGQEIFKTHVHIIPYYSKKTKAVNDEKVLKKIAM